ncbi:hypothetical protein CIB95_08115 [Lottiidibacillus patelloidae]|uniref:Serine aminopeptidase S33 domain-containing protein n=1 Tax=Lottiidibacillus patelloidae TaxID=2670334 RepID=A0A263BUQ3_9BACI|nr:alpha/beta hydrolase [Lottiidibacillus patelloidae]OZM57415.1 hypothetical protein CIB95_08115 [Lottiidibacillus patelloidae]
MTKIINHYIEILGTGVPIVFIHPPGMGHVVFKYQKELANKYQVILYDLQGHGKSDYSGDPLTIPTLSENLSHLLEQCKIEKAYICGYSNGGFVAQDFAIRYPNQTLGIILCGGFSEVTTLLLKKQFEVGIWLAKNNLSLLASLLSFSHKVVKEDLYEMKEYFLMNNQKAIADLYTNGLQYSCTNKLEYIKAPMLLIYGNKDYYIHSYQKIYQEKVPNLKTVYINNAFHQIPTKKAIPFNHAIDHFLKENTQDF